MVCFIMKEFNISRFVLCLGYFFLLVENALKKHVRIFPNKQVHYLTLFR